MIWGSAIGAGFGAASLAALQPRLDFAFSYKAILAFFAGTALVYFYWRFIFSSLAEEGSKAPRTAFTVFMCLLGIAGLLYPLRFVAPNHFGEVLTGLLTAFLALSGVATLLVVCTRFLRES